MKTLSFPKITTALKAKERAKIIFRYALIDDEEGTDHKKEIDDLRSVIPSSQIKEHNFYVELFRFVNMLDFDLQTAYLRLKIIEAKMSHLDFLLNLDTAVEYLGSLSCFLPRFMTRKQYDDLFVKHKQDELSAVFSITQLARHEAIARLKKEGWLKENEYLNDVEERIERYIGRTETKLIDEEVAAIKNALEHWQRLKDREAVFASVYSSYEQYIGLNDDQLREKIKTSGKILFPSQEEISRWQQTVKEEKEKIENLVKEGKLIAQPVGDKTGWYSCPSDKGLPGITALSWYQYQGKLDNSFNEILEKKDDLMDMHEGNIAIPISPWENKQDDCPAEDTRKMIFKLIDDLRIVEKKEEAGSSYLELKPNIKEVILILIKEIYELYARIISYVAAITHLEERFFDGQYLISRKKWFGDAEKETAGEIAKDHNEAMARLIKHYNRFNSDNQEITFPNQEEYFITLPEQTDEKIYKQVVFGLISDAIEKSGFNPHYEG